MHTNVGKYTYTYSIETFYTGSLQLMKKRKSNEYIAD